MTVQLPISKSIAQRLLLLQAMHGDPLMEVSSAMPEDVVRLHDVLAEYGGVGQIQNRTIDLGNAGTPFRFLTAWFAQKEGSEVTLTGLPRMCERPIGQLVDALRRLGADIQYLGKEGFPPVHICGRQLHIHPIEMDGVTSTQFVSALMLIGVPVTTSDSSPYICLTRACEKNYHQLISQPIEADWGAAAFWYEAVALYGGEFVLDGLCLDSLQTDRKVVDCFRSLGVETQELPNGQVRIRKLVKPDLPICKLTNLQIDLSLCPDCYPALAVTCQRLGVSLHISHEERLHHKESDRIESVAQLLATPQGCVAKTFHDHRIAMAAIMAGYKVDDEDCIKKSYPQFISQVQSIFPIPLHEENNVLRSRSEEQGGEGTISHIIPRRGINDGGRGKKFALRQLIAASTAEYVWLHDDDVVLPVISDKELLQTLTALGNPDLVILPLRMTRGEGKLIERLQQAEYVALQALTMQTALQGRAVMCSGANLIVRRERWLESYEDIHPELPSGDDMFLLESFRRRGLRIAAVDDARWEAVVQPQSSFRNLLHQRQRWAGKAPHYTDKIIIRCGLYVLIANLLQIFCPLILLVKFPYEYTLIKKRDASVSPLLCFGLELLYPWYMLLCLLMGIFFRPTRTSF